MATKASSTLAADEIAANKESATKDFEAAVKQRFREAAESAGLLGDDGELNDDLVTERLVEELKTKRVVSIDPDDDRLDPAKSSTKDELTAAIFTAGPSLLDAERNAVEKAVYAKCQSVVWNATQTGKRGRVQKVLQAHKLVLVRGKVFRDANPIHEGIYVSTHEEIIMREFWGPRLDRVRKLAAALADDYEMVKDRVPGLEDPMRDALEAVFVEATAHLPVPTLGSAATNGQKTLD